jgi:hypothetical protein
MSIMKHDFETAIRLPSAPLLLGVMRDPRIVAIEDAQRDEFDAIEKMAINTVKGLEGSYSLFVADSGRSRPRFRNEAARHSEIIPPSVPR